MGCPRESSSDMTSDSSHSFNHEARIARPIENPALPCSPLATVGLRAVPIKRGASKAPQASPYGPRDSMPARGLQLAFMLAFRAHLIATTQLRGVYSLQKNDSQRATNMTFVIHVARNASTWSRGDTRLTTRAILDIRSEPVATETCEHAFAISYYVLGGQSLFVHYARACMVSENLSGG